MRDTLKNRNYFDNAIGFIDDRIKQYLNRLAEPERLNPYGRMGGYAGLCRFTLEKLELCYSRGDDLTTLKEDLINLLKYREMQQHFADALPEEDLSRRLQWERLDFSNYRKTLVWLAFATNISVSQDYFIKLLQLVDNKGLDTIYDSIASKLGDNERPIASKILHKAPYKLLLDTINPKPDQQAAQMNNFLDQWYPACAKQGFYETHEITNDYAYYGYWCFEAALAVNVFNIDDSGFRDHRYYPADLVRARR